MDKKVIKEMITEHEMMLNVITKRLNYLRSLLGGEKTYNLATEMDLRRQEIQEKIEKTRQQALAQVAGLMDNMPKHFGPQGDNFHEKK